ncbi:hypothetical protein F2Q69_00023536 [Brassica cretica]|uniref:Uncharacterized protein n=1 Tax=Brassica cretica TaxID=69181 RepID=A0A8S9Q6F1_BRACR|nr:hypothetical protein F2Q69_00023536 [Brassica cretica]
MLPEMEITQLAVGQMIVITRDAMKHIIIEKKLLRKEYVSAIRSTRDPSIDRHQSTSVQYQKPLNPDGYTRAIDERTLHVSREEIADILQTANGADNLLIHQRNISEHQQKTTKEFYDTAGGIDKSFKQRTRHPTQPSIDVDVPTSVDRRP